MTLFYVTIFIIAALFLYNAYLNTALKPYSHSKLSGADFCVIDIRDYISAYRSPYPGAENIPLSYLSRTLKERFDCPEKILLVSDDKRGAKLAAKIIRKKRHQAIYYIKS
ncbi:rhodanese-like domain-containing protein [Halobacillus sp. K22]|uniref:rhodanese-like domain-containing protein n=1 Tax=Halobacillus sp. K22 TaxID=3457431 RepID=UPI003FCE6099